MQKVGVAELKAELSAYLKRAKAGEEIVVTDRGTPVAMLVPIPRTGGPTEAELEEMYRAGIMRRPKREPNAEWVREFQSRPMPADPEGLVLKALLEERESGW